MRTIDSVLLIAGGVVIISALAFNVFPVGISKIFNPNHSTHALEANNGLLTFDYRLDDFPSQLNEKVDVYFLDLYQTSVEEVQKLRDSGYKTACHFNAGSVGMEQKSMEKFPERVVGKSVMGSDGHRWLDIRAMKQLQPLIESQVQLCKSKGFDYLEPADLIGYMYDTGFKISEADQLAYNLWIADIAKKYGLLVGLSNAESQPKESLKSFDFLFFENCFERKICDDLDGFGLSGKQVFDVEYNVSEELWPQLCEKAKRIGVYLTGKNKADPDFVQVCT